MRPFLILFVVVACASLEIPSTYRFINKSHLKIMDFNDNNIPQKIFAAEIHFSRIPHQYWEHRLQMVKAMGFNALSVYIMWNFHEIEKGKFDYQNGQRNLSGFLDLAKQYGFMVLFRPGPYVCAQWDFGGLPARLLSIKDIKIRANNKLFLDEVKIYFASLAPIMKKYSSTNSGPIILVQIENQYGFYGNDKTYIQALREMWNELKVDDIPQYYVDWIQNLKVCHWEGANVGINNGIVEDDWIKARQIQPKGYLIGGEIYSGWLTHWGQNWQGKNIENYTNEYNFLMTHNHSFSMYMAHGGSNFGLTAGANGFDKKPYDYGGHVTSYDYDAPINEQGSPNKKYHIFRELALKHATWRIPPVPASLNTISIKPFIPAKYADFLENLPEPTLKSVKQLVYFEDEKLKMWNQGFVAYQTNLQKGTYDINITVHDFALVYVNGQCVEILDRSEKTNHSIKIKAQNQTNRLIILVESMGHINFGQQMQSDKKGIISFDVRFTSFENSQKENVKYLEQTDFSWDISTIPIDENMLNWNKRAQNAQYPHLFKYNLNIDEVGDTYLNMQSWKKGYVFVNRQNLGRYWSKGPQLRLFLPGVWLKKGQNEVIVLELLSDSGKFIKGQHNLMLGNQVIEDRLQEKKNKEKLLDLLIENKQPYHQQQA